MNQPPSLALFALVLLGVSPRLEAAPADARPTVAVLYFEYDGANAELAQLRKGFAQMLTSDLAALPDVRVIERARLQDVLGELDLAQSGKVDPATAARVGKLLGARLLVLGSYFEAMGTLRFDARLVETETGRVVAGSGAHGKPEDLLDLEQRLAAKLSDGLKQVATAARSEAPAREPAQAAPPAKRPAARVSSAAVAAYGRALDALDRKDKAAARKELEAAVSASPGFALASADLSHLAL